MGTSWGSDGLHCKARSSRTARLRVPPGCSPGCTEFAAAGCGWCRPETLRHACRRAGVQRATQAANHPGSRPSRQARDRQAGSHTGSHNLHRITSQHTGDRTGRQRGRQISTLDQHGALGVPDVARSPVHDAVLKRVGCATRWLGRQKSTAVMTRGASGEVSPCSVSPAL